MYIHVRRTVKTAVALALLGAVVGAQATETNGSMYPVGAENYMAAALPPPGFYGMVFGQSYDASSLRGNNGDRIPIDFSVHASVIAPRLVWITGQKVLGGDLGFHVIVPLVNLSVSAAGAHQTNLSVGDITFGAVTGYHLSPNLHMILAVDLFAPTGGYNKNDLANVGRNYWAVQPIWGVDYIDPNGFNGSAKVMYEFNATNSDTHYKSGQEFIIDYAAGWGFGPHWVVGVGGYYYNQTTNDKQYGATIANNKGRAFAIGPSVKYDSGKGWFLTAKWEGESDVRNRPQGNAFWLKLVKPL